MNENFETLVLEARECVDSFPRLLRKLGDITAEHTIEYIEDILVLHDVDFEDIPKLVYSSRQIRLDQNRLQALWQQPTLNISWNHPLLHIRPFLSIKASLPPEMLVRVHPVCGSAYVCHEKSPIPTTSQMRSWQGELSQDIAHAIQAKLEYIPSREEIVEARQDGGG